MHFVLSKTVLWIDVTSGQIYLLLFWLVGRDADHSPTSSAEVKNRVELYLYPPKGLRGL